MATRAKFYLYSKTTYAGDSATNLMFQAVTSGSPENDAFFKWTPTGKLEMSVKPEVAERFEIGKSYYLDFTPAEVSASEV